MADDLRPLASVPPQIAELAASLHELCGDDAVAFTDNLEGLSDTVRAARAAVRIIQASEALAETTKELAQRYAARAKDFSDRGARARDVLSHFMQEIDAKSLVLPEATVTLAMGRPSLTGDADAETLPDDLVKIERKPDRAKIKDGLNAGRVVEGYSLSNARPRLQLRVGKGGGEANNLPAEAGQ